MDRAEGALLVAEKALNEARTAARAAQSIVTKGPTQDQVDEAVAKFLAANPPKPGRDGEPGTSVKGDDGRGIKDGFLDSDGNLVLVFTDGGTKNVGRVRGLDGLSAKGEPGKDGSDGLGFDDLEIVHDGERTVTFRYVKGEKVKETAIVFPIPIDRGVFKDGNQYQKGDAVSFGGSAFIAQRDTGDKPETSDAWRLAVKRGRDGAPGKPHEPRKVEPVRA